MLTARISVYAVSSLSVSPSLISSEGGKIYMSMTVASAAPQLDLRTSRARARQNALGEDREGEGMLSGANIVMGVD